MTTIFNCTFPTGTLTSSGQRIVQYLQAFSCGTTHEKPLLYFFRLTTAPPVAQELFQIFPTEDTLLNSGTSLDTMASSQGHSEKFSSFSDKCSCLLINLSINLGRETDLRNLSETNLTLLTMDG